MKELTPEEQQRIEQLELQIAWIKEKFDIQFLSTLKEWVDTKDWMGSLHIHRRKPTKKVVMLESSDIDLHRDLFREGEDCYIFIGQAKSDKYVMMNTNCISFDNLMKFWKRSTDGGKTWYPCSKEVNE